MSLRVPISVEALVHDHLAAQDEVTDIVDSRIYSRLPKTATYPLVVLFRRGGTFRDHEHFDQAVLQVEVWAADNGKAQADELVQTVRAALGPDVICGNHELGHVDDSQERTGLIWLPDPVTGRDRYIFDVQIDTHPAEWEPEPEIP